MNAIADAMPMVLLKHDLSGTCAVHGGGMLCAAGALAAGDLSTNQYYASEIRRCFDKIKESLEAYEAAVAASAEDGT